MFVGKPTARWISLSGEPNTANCYSNTVHTCEPVLHYAVRLARKLRSLPGKESTAVWNLKPERWGSPLFKDKYSGASVHERPCPWTIRFTNKFSEQKTSRMTNGFSDYEHASWQQRQAESISAGVSCWLTLAQYTSLLDLGLRTFRFTNGLQERIKFVNRGPTVPGR
jgi:hypothetical protein